ncbi:unnamed protein product [Symbiodinium natans]|uniref:Uncharacterized protein n=1 Tax=Symbiodinium natans TaxID=878477 RepID=A0A812LQL0_9DINO|nr:unnamed protein product [Symbiodinium natans]
MQTEPRPSQQSAGWSEGRHQTRKLKAVVASCSAGFACGNGDGRHGCGLLLFFAPPSARKNRQPRAFGERQKRSVHQAPTAFGRKSKGLTMAETLRRGSLNFDVDLVINLQLARVDDVAHRVEQFVPAHRSFLVSLRLHFVQGHMQPV